MVPDSSASKQEPERGQSPRHRGGRRGGLGDDAAIDHHGSHPEFLQGVHIAAEAGMRVALTVHLLVALQKLGLVVREGKRWRRSE